MKEQAQAGRGLEDISHYFLTEKKDSTESNQEAVASSQEVVNSENKRNLFLLGSSSKEGRAVLASNLACEWSLNHKAGELIEEEKHLRSSHFFIEGAAPEIGQDQGTITLTQWQSHLNPASVTGEWNLWNLSLESTQKIVAEIFDRPICLVVLEEGRHKLLQAYSEVRKILTLRPEALFYAVRYSNKPAEKTKGILEFFQKTARKFLNIEIRDGGQIVKDVDLAKSILRRKPIVLFSEEKIASKEALKNLAKQLVEV